MEKNIQIDSNQSKKRRITYNENNGEDIISNMPESIISRILSLLPTKDALQTCVLSKDWEYKWTCIYNIDIDDEERFVLKKTRKTCFVNFVDRILKNGFQARPLLKGFSGLNHLNLSGELVACLWDDYDYDEVESVPSCIISHLNEVQFRWFNGRLRKIKRKLPTPASILDLSFGDSGEPSQSSNRQRTPPPPYTPRLPFEYNAQASLFKAPYSDLGARIIGSLGSEAERAVFASKELTSSINSGYNMALLGLMQLHHGMTQMTERCRKAERDLGQTQGGLLSDMDAAMRNAKVLYDNMEHSLRQRLQATEADLEQARLQARVSMDEVRSAEAKAEAQKIEADLAREAAIKARAEVVALKAEVEASRAEAIKTKADMEASRAESSKAIADLEAYIAGEGDRKAALLNSPEFVNMVGPRAFKYLKVGFDGCRDIFQGQGLIPEDRVLIF